MNIPKLHIFTCDDDPETVPIDIALDFSIESEDMQESFICAKKIDAGNDSNIEIEARFTTQNLAYTIAVKSGGKHIFTTMGFKQSEGSSDPCILYTTESKRTLQISVITTSHWEK